MERKQNGQFEKGNDFHDLTGERFGRLVVLKKASRMAGRKCYWECLCDCGKEKEVRSDSLVGGLVRSCGCLKKEADIKNLGITNNHEQTHHPLYGRWNAMLNRCNNPKQVSYKHYGERGIKVCEEWHDINNFIEWAESNGFQKHLTIDRIDVDGNYEPSNCRWITAREQAYNKTNSVFFTWNGETLTLMQWVHKYNIPQWKASTYKKDGIDFLDIISEYASKTIPR